MYLQFTKTNNETYQLKQQGIISTIVFTAAFITGGGFAFLKYLDDSANKNLLFGAVILLGFGIFLLFKQLSFKVIIDPKKKMFTHSRFGITKKFKFEEYVGPSFTKAKSPIGITIGNSLHLDFEQNGKEKRVMIAQNISQKKVRAITEDINQIMNA